MVRNGCFSSSAAVARWAGSRTSRRSKKPFRDGDACEGAEVRTGLLAVGPLSYNVLRHLREGQTGLRSYCWTVKGKPKSPKACFFPTLVFGKKLKAAPSHIQVPQCTALQLGKLCGSQGLRFWYPKLCLWGWGSHQDSEMVQPALLTLCRFFSRGGRLSRIIFIALRGGSLK